MADIAPSLNIVTLTGVVHAPARSAAGPDGNAVVELDVVTGADGRSVRHRVRVVDLDLASTVAHAATGTPVAVVGELDYDSSGAFVAVLARRSCDIRIGGVQAVQVHAKPEPEVVVPAAVQQVRSTSFVPSPVDRPSVQAAPPVDRKLETIAPVMTVVEPVHEPVVEVEQEPIEAYPPIEDTPPPAPVEAPVETPKTVATPPKQNAFAKNGFGSFGSSAPASTTPAQQPAAAKPISALGGLKTTANVPSIQNDEFDEVPVEEKPKSVLEGGRTSFKPSTFGKPSNATVIGPDSLDDDIPF